IIGPVLPNITNAVPLNCNGGTATQVQLNFAPPLDRSGNYEVNFIIHLPNSCRILRLMRSVEPFQVNDCPLLVDLNVLDDPVCSGQCTWLMAVASGGDPNSYSYSWTPTLPDSAAAEICPEGPSSYSVTVSDGFGATAETQIDINPLPSPSITETELNLCQSADPVQLSATPSGGSWSGAGFVDSTAGSGWYDPSLASSLSDTITYTDPINGCTDQLIANLLPLDPGTEDAACPGTAPFLVSGGLPDSGSWSGPHIQPDGWFDPVEIGSFELTYSHPNGCSGSKWVHVGPIELSPVDTLCQSDAPFELEGLPRGGLWSGAGILDSLTGLFDPSEGEPGDNWLHYQINGCSDSLYIFIKGIRAGPNLSACPAQAPFVLPGNWGPTGGNWQGLGIIDTIQGLYDPGLLVDGQNDTLQFTANGCTATRIVFIRQTQLAVQDTLSFCSNEEAFELNENTVGTVPNDGDWEGPGVVGLPQEGPMSTWIFDPALAGIGIHLLIYTANTCSDSLYVEVFPAPQPADEILCEEEGPISLRVDLSPGEWSGPGIVNPMAGIFDPKLAGVGEHEVFFETMMGCRAAALIRVTPKLEANLDTLADYYCFKDSAILIIEDPDLEQLFLDGEPITAFNPAQAGPGIHTLSYSVGSGDCYEEDQIEIEVGRPLQLAIPIPIDTICYGQSTSLLVEGTGGNSLTTVLSYHWDQELGFGKVQMVSPLSTTIYTVILSDGCSDPVTGQIQVFVHPEIQHSYITGPRVCFEDTTFAIISALPNGDEFDYTWSTDPPTYGPRIDSYPTDYDVRIENLRTGCLTTAEVSLPGFDPITANFGFSPNDDCISSLDPEVEILDYSVGGEWGFWDFGDSSQTVPYQLGNFLTHSFPDTGTYIVRLHITNEGGCTSEKELALCVRPEHRLFAPNAFTPNYDGKNDVFRFVGIGISTIEWQVFDRWGKLVFQGDSMEDEWDGWHKGRLVAPEVYTYVARFRTLYQPGMQVMKGQITVLY
ncbi:MAG: gliding motility-associated C-terminal domain-containing protein, partial [Bacteroidota bacterium]